MFYRKKPVVIEAVLFGGECTQDEVREFLKPLIEAHPNEEVAVIGSLCVTIKTLEGFMRADVGDYIIKGVKGEFYPCKPDIFEATYEAVAEPGTPA